MNCKGIKVNGQKCLRRTMNNYCWIHKKQNKQNTQMGGAIISSINCLKIRDKIYCKTNNKYNDPTFNYELLTKHVYNPSLNIDKFIWFNCDVDTLQCSENKNKQHFDIGNVFYTLNQTKKNDITMYNVGNTCYYNSVITSLFVLNTFTDMIIQNMDYYLSIPNSPLKMFSNMIFEKLNNKHVTMKDLKNICTIMTSDIYGPIGEHQDAAEYLRYILNIFRNDIIENSQQRFDTLFVTKYYSVLSDKYNTCDKNDGYPKLVSEDSSVLSVQIETKNDDVQKSLDNYFSNEEISFENNPWCNSDERKKFRILCYEWLSTIIVTLSAQMKTIKNKEISENDMNDIITFIQLGIDRNNNINYIYYHTKSMKSIIMLYGSKNDYINKENRLISALEYYYKSKYSTSNRKIPTIERSYKIRDLSKYFIIQLKRFINISHIDDKSGNVHENYIKDNTIVNPNMRIDLRNYLYANDPKTKTEYELVAIVYHIGNLNGGHYINVVKMSNDIWIERNDSTITEIKENKIQSNYKGFDAYILFYSRIDNK